MSKDGVAGTPGYPIYNRLISVSPAIFKVKDEEN